MDRPVSRLVHLYERYVFIDDTLPDGQIADTNHLWLSDWYLANLNSQYCGPINYELWQFLNNESRIASRLYEYLTWNFSKRIPVFRISYQKLAQFLPVKPLPHLSQIRQQLEPALGCLQRQQLIEAFRWERGSTGQVMLAITPANRLVAPDSSPPTVKPAAASGKRQEKMDKAATTQTERRLIAEFYREWSGTADIQPGTKEITLAQELIQKHGPEETERLLPLVVKLLKQTFPDAQNFGATRSYWPRAVQQEQKSARRQQLDLKVRQDETAAENSRQQERLRD